jgi:hypothetical protein
MLALVQLLGLWSRRFPHQLAFTPPPLSFATITISSEELYADQVLCRVKNTPGQAS